MFSQYLCICSQAEALSDQLAMDFSLHRNKLSITGLVNVRWMSTLSSLDNVFNFMFSGDTLSLCV